MRVRARYHDAGGNITESGPWSDPPVELTIAALPDKPTGLSASPSHDSVLLSWTTPGDSGITGYQVLRGSDADNLAVLVDNTGKSSLSYTDSTVTAETTYAYAIRARNADGLSPQSDPVSVTTPAAPVLPAKPTGLSTNPSHNSVDLSWTDPNDNSITGYQVLRGPDAANLTVLNNDTGSGTASYTDNTVDAETTYAYAIRAKNAQGLSPQSDAVSTTTPAAPPAKPTGISYGASYNNVLLLWTDPGDDSITGYQILRGPDATNLAVLTDDTGSTDASYSDDTVEAETTYAYAIRARNANGLSPQSDAATANTPAAPVEPEIALAVAGVEFIIAGQTLDTTGTCIETDITMIADECTENITNPMPQFGVVGTLDGNDLVLVGIGRNLAGLAQVADQSDLQGLNKRINPTFQPGRNLLRVWGDEDGDPSASEAHYFRVNVVPYWEWNGNILSKDSDCRDTTANAPAVDEITDDDCIVAPQFGNTAELRFFNVINEHFNVYVEVNGTNVISEPSTSDLGSSFTVNLDAGDNLIRVRLAAKGGQPTAEVYDSDSFYYKVTGTDTLVSNLGEDTDSDEDPKHIGPINLGIAIPFTTGSNPNGYKISAVRVDIAVFTGTTPLVSIYSDVSGRPGSSLRVLTNPSTISSFTRMQLNDGLIDVNEAVEEADFGADNLKLDAEKQYWVVFERASGSETVYIDETASNEEDSGTAPGWSIGNSGYFLRSGQTWSTAATVSNVNRMAIKGTLVPESDDATLSGLALTDPDNNVVALEPTFASGVESYTATVANAVSQIKVEPNKNDDNAAVQYLDSDDMVLTDADTNTGVFDVNLDEGENVIKVKVTAEDGTTMKTYVVTVTRVDFLVSNLGQTTASLSAIGRMFGTGRSTASASPFTTGSNTGGYKISAVRLSVAIVTGTTPMVSIYSDNSGEPGTSLKVLDNPANIPSFASFGDVGNPALLDERDFDADDFRLEADTTYWVVIERATSSGFFFFKFTSSSAEDSGTAPGWRILDSWLFQYGNQQWTASDPANAPIQFSVKGEPVTATAPGAPASLTATPGNAQATLTWTPPASDGGAAIIKYQYRVSSDSGSTWNPDWTDVPDGSDAGTDLDDERTLTVTNLINGTLYTFQVRAVNSVGSGTLAEDTATPAAQGSTTLTALVLKDASANTITINPTFAYDVESYTATVAHAVDQITVEPTKFDNTSTIKYLDSNDMELSDADATTTGVFDVDLAEGENVIKVEVTSSDAMTKTTYVVTVTRVDFLVSNAGSIRNAGTGGVTGTIEAAIQFTTGSNTGGYEIDTVRLQLQVPAGTTPKVSIYSDSSGQPGTSLKELSNPSTIPTSTAWAEFDASDYRLNPTTSYWIVIGRASGTNSVNYKTTESTAEDPGTKPGWSIGNRLSKSQSGVWFSVGGSLKSIPQLTIKGEPATATPPDLQSAAINGAELTLEFSNTLDATSRPARSAFEVKVRGTAVSLSSSNPVSISGSTVTLRLQSAVTAGDTVTVSYTAPGANPIKDDAALEAPSFIDESAFNNTPNAPPTGLPVISGTPERGQTLTVSTSGIRDADGLSNPRYSYGWERFDGATDSIIPDSNSQSYLLTRDDVGKKIKVLVSFYDDAETRGALESDAFPASGTIQNKSNQQPTGRPTLSGTDQVGHTLTASTSGIDDRDGLTSPGYTYQWQRRESGVYTDITGADSMVYTLTPDDQGKRVRVQVTFTDDDENVHTLESSPSGVVQAQTSLPSSKVKVSLDATAYVVEEGDTVQVTVTLAEAPQEGPVYIRFTLTPENGATRSEFRAWSSSSSDSLRFATGQTTDWIKIRADDDTLNDDGETITLCLIDLPEPYATLAGRDCATINILDNDDPNSVRVSFDRGNYWASEDGNPAWPRITVEPVPDREITIPITFTRGGGLSAADHGAVATSVTFGPGRYGVHGDGHLSDNRTYASFPIEIWAIDDRDDDDGEYLDLAFGPMPDAFVTKDTGYRLGGDSRAGFRRPANQSRVWFNDNEFTQVSVTDPPNPLGLSRRMKVTFADAELEAKEGLYEIGTVATVRVQLSRRRNKESTVIHPHHRDPAWDHNSSGLRRGRHTQQHHLPARSDRVFLPGESGQRRHRR